MATRQTGSYDTPAAAFDVNAKGTANVFFAAVENGVKALAPAMLGASVTVYDWSQGNARYARPSPCRSSS